MSTKNRNAAALSGPPQRPRANRENMPAPPASASTSEQSDTPAPLNSEQEAPKHDQQNPQQEREVAPELDAPAQQTATDSTPASRARQALAARNAEQTFLPLVSRVAKLTEWIEQSELAVDDALDVGVDPGQLEDVLRSIARKNGVPYDAIPASVRKAVAGASEGESGTKPASPA